MIPFSSSSSSSGSSSYSFHSPSSSSPSSSSSSSSSSTQSISSSSSEPQLSRQQLYQKIFETLSDKRNDDATTANYLFKAYSNGVIDHIYAVVDDSIRIYGPDNIKISEGVIKILAGRGIALIQNEDGVITMHKELIISVDDDKGASGDKVGCIEFSQRNEGAIFEALRYGSVAIKETIIRQAVQQGKAAFLNQLIPRFFLAGVNLSGVDLRELNLQEAVLAKANLSKSNMGGLDLTHANLNEANLDGADLRGAILYRASFVTGSARGSNFAKANLEELSADGTDFSGARIANANCKYASFVAATLTDVDLRGTPLDDTHIAKVKAGNTLISAHTEDTVVVEGFVITEDPSSLGLQSPLRRLNIAINDKSAGIV